MMTCNNITRMCMHSKTLLLAVQRILDIRFVPGVLETIKKQQLHGAAFPGVKSYV